MWIPFAERIFLSSTQQKQLRTGCGVLVLHKIGPPPPNTRDPFEYTTVARLDECLQAAKAAGLRFKTLAECHPQSGFNSRTLAITFDDGYSNVLKNALPVLARHEVRAIEFLVAAKLGGRNDWDVAKGDAPEELMDAAQVRDWLAAGQSIGSHSLTHPNLRKIARTQAREEITASRKKLEDLFGVPVKHFCYPFGSFDERVRDLVMEAGYDSASTVISGVNRPQTDRFALRRLAPYSAHQLFAKARHRFQRRFRFAT